MTSPDATPQPLPPDDPSRELAVARPDADDATLAHISVAGDTYTILLTGEDTAGHFTLIDRHIPAGGGPPPHRHSFEETFTILDGELEVTFRGATSVLRTGETVNVPTNAPRFFHNASGAAARMLCICAPPGQEEFFMAIGDPVDSRTAPTPQLDENARAARTANAERLALRYCTELLVP